MQSSVSILSAPGDTLYTYVYRVDAPGVMPLQDILFMIMPILMLIVLLGAIYSGIRFSKSLKKEEKK